MEKKQLYKAPSYRYVTLRTDSNFLTSLDGGIDPWIPDDGEVDF